MHSEQVQLICPQLKKLDLRCRTISLSSLLIIYPDPPLNTKTGPLYAFLAYGSWGLLPIYWKLLGSASAIEVLSHRMLWSLLFLGIILTIQRRLAELHKLQHQQVFWLLVTALLLSCNWGLYIYGVNTDRVVETSLGYFINPLVSVLLGFVCLREKLHRGQQLAVLLATLGVGYFIWQFGAVPWIALGLAGTFALYGLLRKVVAVAPLVGLTVETALMTPVAIAIIGYWGITGTGEFGTSPGLTLLFIGAGVATSMPLLWFNNAAKRLSLATLGFCQYIAPSMQLLLGVFLYQEPFTQTHLVSFSLIWTALLVYSTTSLFHTKAIS